MMNESKNGAEKALSGVYAALITPVGVNGRPDSSRLADLVDFVVGRGVDGLCLGGGTAEFPHFNLEDRKRLVEMAARCLDDRVSFVTAVGAPTLRGVIELAEHALGQGSRALLIPMPFFYRYGQEDLAAYVREVVVSLEATCLLYNLPAFTNPIDTETSISLLRSLPNLVGMKDSSGNRDALSILHEARSDSPFTLMCGSDGIFYDALEAGWDGGISGIASCCPEILVALYHHHKNGRMDEARDCQNRLHELVAMVERLPFPWSIRIAAEVRGIPNGPLPYPLSESRLSQAVELRKEFESWFEENLPIVRADTIVNPE